MKNLHKKVGMIAIKKILLYILFFCYLITGATAQFNALDYRLQKRPKLEKFESSNFFDNTFVSGSFGLQINSLVKKVDRDMGPVARYYFGKWFTPVIGARFGIDMSILNSRDNKAHAMFGFDLDYLANLSAFVAGYNPDRLFDLYGFAGVTYKRSFRYGYGTNMYGGSLGLQGNFNLTRLISVYIEPRVTIANDSYNERAVDRKYDVLPEVTVGLAYKMQPTPRVHISDLDKTKFKENIFFSMGLGIQRPLSNLVPSHALSVNIGPSGMLAFGGWFKHIHGVRLSAYAGYSKYFGETYNPNNRLGAAILRADYMVNYSNLFAGYNENRIFDMIGTFGPELAFSGQSGTKWKMSGGFGIGLQGSFKVAPAIDVFVEPRISFYTTNYTNGDYNRYDASASLLLGVTYHSVTKEYRKENDEFERKSVVDHMFASLSTGVGGTYSRIKEDLHGGKNIAGRITLSLGSWITPISGIQVSGGTVLYGTNYSYGAYYRARTLVLGLDYLFNVTNALKGYKEDRLFELVAVGGVGSMYHHSTFYPILQAEMQAKFNLKKNWSIFAAPQALWAIPRGILTGSVSTRKSLILTGNIGTTYRMRGYDPASVYAFKENEGRRMFFSIAGGFGGVIDDGTLRNVKESISPAGRMSIGSWMSPLSGWRLSFVSDRIKQVRSNKYITHGGIVGEYMFDITTAAVGYKPERLFNLYAIAGVHAGFSIVEHKMRFIPGFTGSVQGAFRITPNFSLFLEPQLAVYLNKFDGSNKQKSVGMMFAGLTYTINKENKNEAREVSLDKQNFVSVSAGVGLWGNTLMSEYGDFNDKLTYSFTAAYGRWITPVHGLRLNIDYTNITQPYQLYSEPLNTFAGRIDYMMNITNMLSGYDETRLFDAIAFVGVGGVIPFSKKYNSTEDIKPTYTLAFGLQAKFNISDKFDVYIEPKGTFYGDKVDGYRSRAKFDATASLLAGFNYKF